MDEPLLSRTVQGTTQNDAQLEESVNQHSHTKGIAPRQLFLTIDLLPVRPAFLARSLLVVPIPITLLRGYSIESLYIGTSIFLGHGILAVGFISNTLNPPWCLLRRGSPYSTGRFLCRRTLSGTGRFAGRQGTEKLVRGQGSIQAGSHTR